MGKRTLTAVLTSEEVQRILGEHLIAARGVSVVPGSQTESELMAIAEKDSAGQININQYRFEITVEEARESWRG